MAKGPEQLVLLRGQAFDFLVLYMTKGPEQLVFPRVQDFDFFVSLHDQGPEELVFTRVQDFAFFRPYMSKLMLRIVKLILRTNTLSSPLS